MNENGETVVLNVTMDALIESLRHLEKQYELNAAALADYTKEEQKSNETAIKLAQENKVLRQEIAGVEKQIQNNIKVEKAQQGSLVAMRAELSNLNKLYDSLDGFTRMGVEGEKLRAKIETLSAEIQGLEESTGRWQRNVGNYKSALGDLKDGFSAAGLSTKGLDSAMKLLHSNPLFTILGVVVTVLVKLRDRLKDNEKVTASLGKAMSSLQPIMDWFSKAVSKLADIFSNVLDWAIEKTIEALGWLGRQLQKLGKVFGKDWGGGLIEYSATMKGVAQNTEEAATATDTLAESINSVAKAASEAKREVQDLIKELKSRDLSDNIQRDLEKAKEAIEAIEKLDTKAYEKYKDVGDEGLDDIERKSNSLVNFALLYKENAKDIESVSSSLQSAFGSVASMYEQLAKDESKSEEERAKAAKKAKAWSAIQIAANSGTAVAKGVAAAMDNPWPANIAAIASTLAAVMAAIAQAKQLASQQYETGGVIGGFNGATLGRDNTVASVRTGEMVINAKQQKQLFEIANGGATTSLAASLAAAIQSMPAPVLEYSEFTRFQDRVATLNENAKLK